MSVTVKLPDVIEAVTSEGYTIQGRTVNFPGFRLAPGASKSLTFRAVGLAAGDLVVRAVVETDFSVVPVMAETVVYFYDEEELQQIARELDAVIRLR